MYTEYKIQNTFTMHQNLCSVCSTKSVLSGALTSEHPPHVDSSQSDSKFFFSETTFPTNYHVVSYTGSTHYRIRILQD